MIGFWIQSLLLAYLCGSVPFGLILTRLAGLGDVRNIGSGNIGATNVMRTGNKKLAVLTLLLDVLKGCLPILLIADFVAKHYKIADIQLANASGTNLWLLQNVEMVPYIAALCAVLGHMFPIWLKFKGGKGVATAIGVYLGIYWLLGWLVIVWWIGIFALFRTASLASIVSLVLAPLFPLCLGNLPLTLLGAVIAALVMFKHKDNIRRLMKGEEPRFK